MAVQSILRHHLRRALSLSTAIRHRQTTTPTLLHLLPTATTATTTVPRRSFHSSRTSSGASPSLSDLEKINRYNVLCEEYDLNHWLIVMNFGKDRPSPDQMVETYIQTCAVALGSVEEAKKRIYALSTNTYTGFQVEVDEETSKKFKGLPGVMFVVPDTYVDPVTKEYGGDKFINGVVIPGPIRGYRSNDRRPRDSMPNQQGNPGYNQQENPGYNQQGIMPQGERSYAPPGQQQGFPPQENFPPQQSYSAQQNYGASGQEDRGMSPAVNQYAGVGMDGYQGGQRNLPPQQQNFPPQQNYGPSVQADRGVSPAANQYAGVGMDGYQGGLRNLPPQQQNFPPQPNYGPSGQADRGVSPAANQYAGVGMDGYQGGLRNLFPPQQNLPPQQNYSPQLNYGPSGQADRGVSPGGNQYADVGLNAYQGGQRNLPPQQGNYNHGYNHPQGQMNNVTGNYGGSAQPGQYHNDSRDHGYTPPQGPLGNLPGDHGGYAPPGPMGTSSHDRTNFPSPVTGVYGQTGAGSFPQSGAGQGPNPNSFGHGAGYASHGENQRFQPTSNVQSNPLGPGNYSPGTQITFNQGIPSGNSYGHGAGYMSHAEQQRFPPASNEQSNSTEHGNYPLGTQTGFNQGWY